MRISDWSSDVCSSDLVSARAGNQTGNRVAVLRLQSHDARRRPAAGKSGAGARPSPRALFHRTLPGFEGERPAGAAVHHQAIDRKSVVSGKSVSVRVDLGGRRLIKKKNKLSNHKSYISLY